jgi:hypothetical protein
MATSARATLLAGLAVVVLAGCGPSGGESSDDDQVRQTASDFLDAVRDGDGARACDLLGEEAREKVERFARQYGRTLDSPTDCAKVLELSQAQYPSDFRIVNIDIDGGQATASADGGIDGSVEVPLVKDGDDWKVDQSDF